MICSICRTPIHVHNSVTLKDKGVDSLLNACEVRGENALFEHISYQKSTDEPLTVHAECRKKFTDLRKFSKEIKAVSEPPNKKTRTSSEVFDWEKSCVFCAKTCSDRCSNDRKQVCHVETIEFRKSIIDVCDKTPYHPSVALVHHRVNNCIDLVAVTARYHKQCAAAFFSNDEKVPNVDEDERPAEGTSEKRKVGKPRNPITEVAFGKTCEWLEDSAEPMSLQEVESYMAEITGNSSIIFSYCVYLFNYLILNV